MTLRLSRLPTNWKDQPQLFERYWDETLNQIEKNINQLLSVPIIQQQLAATQTAVVAAQAAAAAAMLAADTAQTAANTVTTTANNTAREASLSTSYINVVTSPLISVTSGGVVTIQTHTRVYGNTTLNPSVSVTGGSVATGAASGAVIRIYYVDATRAGGAVSYLYTVDGVNPPPVQTGDTHSVGVVTVPATGSADGKFIRPPGYIES